MVWIEEYTPCTRKEATSMAGLIKNKRYVFTPTVEAEGQNRTDGHVSGLLFREGTFLYYDKEFCVFMGYPTTRPNVLFMFYIKEKDCKCKCKDT